VQPRTTFHREDLVDLILATTPPETGGTGSRSTSWGCRAPRSKVGSALGKLETC
jgi:hypothetical protein